jgi:hypothetical protein
MVGAVIGAMADTVQATGLVVAAIVGAMAACRPPWPEPRHCHRCRGLPPPPPLPPCPPPLPPPRGRHRRPLRHGRRHRHHHLRHRHRRPSPWRLKMRPGCPAAARTMPRARRRWPASTRFFSIVISAQRCLRLLAGKATAGGPRSPGWRPASRLAGSWSTILRRPMGRVAAIAA